MSIGKVSGSDNSKSVKYLRDLFHATFVEWIADLNGSVLFEMGCRGPRGIRSIYFVPPPNIKPPALYLGRSFKDNSCLFEYLFASNIVMVFDLTGCLGGIFLQIRIKILHHTFCCVPPPLSLPQQSRTQDPRSPAVDPVDPSRGMQSMIIPGYSIGPPLVPSRPSPRI